MTPQSETCTCLGSTNDVGAEMCKATYLVLELYVPTTYYPYPKADRDIYQPQAPTGVLMAYDVRLIHITGPSSKV